MDYPVAYARVVRYGLLPRSSLTPFFDSHYAGEHQAAHALADYLGDNDDPRSAVVARHLGLTRHPDHEQWREAGGGYRGVDDKGKDISAVVVRDGEYRLGDSEERDPDGMSILYFHPSVRNAAGGQRHKSVYVSFYHSRVSPNEERRKAAGLNYFDGVRFAGNFTEDESRWMADRLPEPHAAEVHGMLDRHFGKRQPTAD